MSKAYRDKFGDVIVSRDEMRKFLNIEPPKRDGNGNIMYFTEQAHKDRCDVNKIVKRYTMTGVMEHVNDFEGSFGELSGVDFKVMMDKIALVNSRFQEIPSGIRRRFGNDPARFLDFFNDKGNYEEAKKLGILPSDWLDAAPAASVAPEVIPEAAPPSA